MKERKGALFYAVANSLRERREIKDGVRNELGS